jgi:hypothetical protein
MKAAGGQMSQVPSLRPLCGHVGSYRVAEHPPLSLCTAAFQPLSASRQQTQITCILQRHAV